MSEARSADAPSAEDQRGETFSDFYRREYERAVRLAWLLTGSQSVAEDAVQDAMTAMYRRFDGINSPRAYLRRSVINAAKSRQRNEQRWQERRSLVDGERSAAESAADLELLDAIGRLPYRQRVVIVARYWGEWSELEIAQALDCRPGTVKSLASRALKRLRSEIKP